MIVLNPGTGPVEETSVAQAETNIKVYAEEIAAQHGLLVLAIHRDQSLDYREGRYAFRLDCQKSDRKWTLEIQMPGLPTEKVRYLGTPGQSAWDFPRLYLNGSSWLWKYAVDLAVPERQEEEPKPEPCPEKIDVHGQKYQCLHLKGHNAECMTRIVVAGYVDEALGPNIKSSVTWVPGNGGKA